MSDGITFDFSEINQLAADLADAPRDAGPKIRKAVEVSAFKVKESWRDKLKGTKRMPVAFLSVDYEIAANTSIVRDALSSLNAGADTIEAEIGARTGKKQATFVTVLEFGAPGNNLAPRGYGAGALQENQEDFVKGLEIAIGEPLK